MKHVNYKICIQNKMLLFLLAAIILLCTVFWLYYTEIRLLENPDEIVVRHLGKDCQPNIVSFTSKIGSKIPVRDTTTSYGQNRQRQRQYVVSSSPTQPSKASLQRQSTLYGFTKEGNLHAQANVHEDEEGDISSSSIQAIQAFMEPQH